MSETSAVSDRLQKIREAFARQLPAQLEGIRSAYAAYLRDVDEHSAEELHRRIHTVRGASASFGHVALSAAAAVAEGLAKGALSRTLPPDERWREQMSTQLAQMEAEAGVDPVEKEQPALVAPAQGEAAPQGEKKVVYLCEDDAFQRMNLATQIGCFGFEVVPFADTESFYSAVREAPPDAIVMDMMFPGHPFGGGEVVSQLQGERKEQIPTIFISCQDDISFRLAAVRAGSDAYFVKPINVADLCSTISDLTTVEESEPYRILIIDDDPHLSQLHSIILEDAGMVTCSVHDPLQVMPHLFEFKPDLILMDMHMPGCNGMELAKAIRQINFCFSIPIVFLSSETDTDMQFDARRMGGDEFLSKPIKARHLITSVAVRAERMKILRSFMVRDGMTGLYNHTATKEQLDVAIALAHRSGNPLCFAMLDIDLFKKVNDTYGHAAGDRVLVTLAHLLRRRLRKEDVVGRFGGEEFAVVLPGCDAPAAQALLDQLRQSYAAIRFEAGGETFSSTFSCGVAQLKARHDVESLCKLADEALYEAKGGGRNRVAVRSGS